MYSEPMEQTPDTANRVERTRKKPPPEPSTTRTNRDWVMVMLGVLLVGFFLTAGYLGVMRTNKNSLPMYRGPVKDPHKRSSTRMIVPVTRQAASIFRFRPS